MMDRYEYTISRHSADTFRELIVFCSEDGKCNLEQVPSNQMEVLRGILNTRGLEGWELVQVAFGKDGILVFWKRKVSVENESVEVRSE